MFLELVEEEKKGSSNALSAFFWLLARFACVHHVVVLIGDPQKTMLASRDDYIVLRAVMLSDWLSLIWYLVARSHHMFHTTDQEDQQPPRVQNW